MWLLVIAIAHVCLVVLVGFAVHEHRRACRTHALCCKALAAMGAGMALGQIGSSQVLEKLFTSLAV